jgi:hypothetical protein
MDLSPFLRIAANRRLKALARMNPVQARKPGEVNCA